MKKSELVKIAQGLIGPNGFEVAKQAYAAEPRLKPWLDEVAQGFLAAYEKEKVFGRGKRQWYIHAEKHAISFLREEWHDTSENWDSMGESFRVDDPEFVEEEE